MEEIKVIEELENLGYSRADAKAFIADEREKQRNVQTLEKERAARKKKKREKERLLRNLF